MRLCSSADGTRIAYQMLGAGPALVHVAPWGLCNAELDWEHPLLRAFYSRLARERLLVRLIRRGIGASQREATDVSLNAQFTDLSAVITHVGLKEFDLFGGDDGAGAAVMYAAKCPEQVRRLVLWAPYGRAGGEQHPAITALASRCLTDWKSVLETFARINFPSGPPESRSWLMDYHLRSVAPETAAMYLKFSAGIDVRDYLSQITAPTLVLHRRGDQIVAFHAGRAAASNIRDARFLALEGDVHPPGMGDASYVESICSFLAGAEVVEQSHRRMPLRTILWTDIVDHTKMMQRLGDEKGRQLLKKHEKITRDILIEHGGSEVKTMGDGFLATFSSVTGAVECAIALQRAFASRNAWLPRRQDPTEGSFTSRTTGTDALAEPIQIRVGLNAGEPIEEEGDLFGATVILTSRIAGKAEGGEILVADTVRGVCSGKGFLFSDRGEFVAKGFEEPVRVYELRWEA